MSMMKAIGLYQYLPIENPESLLDVTIEKPVPLGHDLLVQVRAISVNPVDTKVRSPKDAVENTPKILGWDVSGVVEAVGAECTLFKPGDEVFYAGDITRPGGNSEYHLIDERIVGTKPKSLDFAEAAALPLTSITAWEALFDRLLISSNPVDNANRTLLIIGAAGGVGSIATQLARNVGLTVIGTASRTETVAWTKTYGSTYTIDHTQPFLPQLQSLGFASVDYIFCLNNTEQHWEGMAEAIAPQGKICSIVGVRTPLNLNLLNNKSVTFVWEYMFTRPMHQTPDMEAQHRLLNAVSAQVDAGQLRTTLTTRLSPINADTLKHAHRLIESGRTIGKIVLEGFPSQNDA